MNDGAIAQLRDVLEQQPTWSDFPLILLTVGGRVTAESERLRDLRGRWETSSARTAGSPETLLSTLEIALRGRERQYQIRDQMHQYARAQDALRRSEKLAVTGRLAASIAHEINNPLEAVTNLLFLMRALRARAQAHVSCAGGAGAGPGGGDHQQTLRFYREPSHPVDTLVASVLRSVLVLYNSRLLAAGVEVLLEVDAPEATVLASPGELRQVIANIVGNAIDAMRHGGRLRLRITEENGAADEPRIRLTIADTGSGIPAALLPSIFEPFVTTKGETGTGLGLWVTGEIMRRNGWDIRVRSRCGPHGSGTVFSITMPLRAAAVHMESAAAVA